MTVETKERAGGRAGGQGEPPVAARVRPPSWRDTRLLVGVVLVLASVALGARVVTMAADTEPYYVATRDLTPGDTLGAGDVQVVQVRLDSASGAHLSASQPLTEGLRLRRPVGSGELLPLAAVGDGSDVQVRPVGVPLSQPLPPSVAKGSVVDVWVGARTGDPARPYAAPLLLAEGVTLADVQEAGTGMGSTGQGHVQVLVDEQALPALLDSVANEDAVLVVPAGRGL